MRTLFLAEKGVEKMYDSGRVSQKKTTCRICSADHRCDCEILLSLSHRDATLLDAGKNSQNSIIAHEKGIIST